MMRCGDAAIFFQLSRVIVIYRRFPTVPNDFYSSLFSFFFFAGNPPFLGFFEITP
jgi:hypothetical protein